MVSIRALPCPPVTQILPAKQFGQKIKVACVEDLLMVADDAVWTTEETCTSPALLHLKEVGHWLGCEGTRGQDQRCNQMRLWPAQPGPSTPSGIAQAPWTSGQSSDPG